MSIIQTLFFLWTLLMVKVRLYTCVLLPPMRFTSFRKFRLFLISFQLILAITTSLEYFTDSCCLLLFFPCCFLFISGRECIFFIPYTLLHVCCHVFGIILSDTSSS